MKKIKNLLLLLLMVAIGVAGAMFMKKSKKPLEHDANAMQARYVDIITVQKKPFAAHVTAYGNIEPEVVLEGRAEVSGKVSYIHPSLKEGGSIAAGATVVRIDPEDYKTSLQQSKADVAASESQLAQLNQEEKNVRTNLKLAEEKLRIGQKELKRLESIWDKRLIARSTVDAQEQNVIQLRQSVADLEGQLQTFKSRRANISAQINRSQSQLEGRKTTLGRTEIKMPFDARISRVDVQAGEFIPVGGILFEAINTDGVEIEAELPIRHMRILVASMNGKKINLSAGNAQEMIQSLGLKARIRLVGVGLGATWEGRVVRISEAIDTTRRTLGVVIAVDKPNEDVVLGVKPPLLKGMYVAVDLIAPEQEQIVIPRKAVHQGRVYLVDEDDKLEIREVEVQALQNDKVVIGAGLQQGDQLIINDLIPVIEGMPLAPLEASEAETPLGSEAKADQTESNEPQQAKARAEAE